MTPQPGDNVVLKARPKTGHGQLIKEIEPGVWKIQFPGFKEDHMVWDFIVADE